MIFADCRPQTADGCVLKWDGDKGTGTRGGGNRDASVWDLGLGDAIREDIEDIKYGTRGRVGRGHRDVKDRDARDTGCERLSQKSEVNAIYLSS